MTLRTERCVRDRLTILKFWVCNEPTRPSYHGIATNRSVGARARRCAGWGPTTCVWGCHLDSWCCTHLCGARRALESMVLCTISRGSRKGTRKRKVVDQWVATQLPTKDGWPCPLQRSGTQFLPVCMCGRDTLHEQREPLVVFAVS